MLCAMNNSNPIGVMSPAARSPAARGLEVSAYLPGVLASGAVALTAVLLCSGPWFAAHAITPLAAAILAGLLLGNLLPPATAAPLAAGIGFSKQTVLRLGVVLYGLRLTLADIGRIGLHGVLVDAAMLVSTFALAWVLGTRVLKMERRTVMLIGAGSSICGAAAVLAAEPVVRGEPQQVAIAVATVLLFGTAAIFVYPALYQLNLHWQVLPAGPAAFGIYAGATIHEVAQVFAAARAIGPQTADIAVVTKLVRVMMLAPFLVIVSVLLNRGGDTSAARSNAGHWLQGMPWFALWFVVVVAVNSWLTLPPMLVHALVQADTLLLAGAMAALGFATQLSAIRKAGLKPVVLGGALFAWLVAGGVLISRFV